MEKLKSLIQRKAWRIFITAVCFNLVIFGVYSYLYLSIQKKNQHIAELTASVEELTARRESLKSAKENISKTSELQKEIDNYFIPKDGVVRFLNLIQSLGNQNRLSSYVVSVVEKPTVLSPDIFESLDMQLEVSGSFADVYHFAALLELLPYKVSIGGMNLEKLPSDAAKSSAGSSKQGLAIVGPWKGTFSLSVLKFK